MTKYTFGLGPEGLPIYTRDDQQRVKEGRAKVVPIASRCVTSC